MVETSTVPNWKFPNYDSACELSYVEEKTKVWKECEARAEVATVDLRFWSSFSFEQERNYSSNKLYKLIENDHIHSKRIKLNQAFIRPICLIWTKTFEIWPCRYYLTMTRFNRFFPICIKLYVILKRVSVENNRRVKGVIFKRKHTWLCRHLLKF